MTTAQLAKKISSLEGKKVQSSIGNIREILKILVKIEKEALKQDDDLDYELSSVVHWLNAQVKK
jgi:hypothetical protein